MSSGNFERRGPSWRTQPRESDLIVRCAVAAAECVPLRSPISDVIRRRYAGDNRLEATLELSQIVNKQDPAMTTVPAWAGALLQDGVAQLLDQIGTESITTRLPVQRGQFGQSASIKFAVRANRTPADPNLAAAFRGEGAPIRVGAAALQGQKLAPKSMGVIGTFTEELFKRSTTNIEQVIKQWMLEDTAHVLDGVFLGDGAGDDVTPAGIASGLAAGDTIVSSGNSAAQIDADVRSRIAALLGHGMGRRPVWIMHTARALGLAGTKTPGGAPLYPSMSESPPRLYNIPVEHALSAPLDVVFLVDASEVALAVGVPEFLGSREAAFHEESDAAAVSPIVDGAGVVAHPTRSLFQTACAALRGIWEVNWVVLRPGAVQTITGVSW